MGMLASKNVNNVLSQSSYHDLVVDLLRHDDMGGVWMVMTDMGADDRTPLIFRQMAYFGLDYMRFAGRRLYYTHHY